MPAGRVRLYGMGGITNAPSIDRALTFFGSEVPVILVVSEGIAVALFLAESVVVATFAVDDFLAP